MSLGWLLFGSIVYLFCIFIFFILSHARLAERYPWASPGVFCCCSARCVGYGVAWSGLVIGRERRRARRYRLALAAILITAMCGSTWLRSALAGRSCAAVLWRLWVFLSTLVHGISCMVSCHVTRLPVLTQLAWNWCQRWCIQRTVSGSAQIVECGLTLCNLLGCC